MPKKKTSSPQAAKVTRKLVAQNQQNFWLIGGLALLALLLTGFYFKSQGRHYFSQRTERSAKMGKPRHQAVMIPDGSNSTKRVLWNAELLVPETSAMSKVQLKDGQGQFKDGQTSGTVTLGEVFATVPTGPDSSDLYAVMNVNDGGSGTFAYLLLITMENGKPMVSSYLPIGDRVVVRDILQTTRNINSPKYGMVVNYLDRAPNEPMSNPASVPKALLFTVDQSVIAK